MEKMTYNSLAVAIALATGIMLATSVSAASVLAQQYTAPPTSPKAGNATGNSPMKSGNTTSAGSMMNKTATGNATEAGNTTAANMTKAAGKILKSLYTILANYYYDFI
jgi:Flp pilus assembly protein TadD